MLMDNLSKLTLKGYFEQLKTDVGQTSGIRKEDIKAKGYETLRDESTFQLLELLIKAVALVEEMHQNDTTFLLEDHVNDYCEMIQTLNKHGIAYKGNTDILDLETNSPLNLSKKKPMQRAKSASKNQADQTKKVG